MSDDLENMYLPGDSLNIIDILDLGLFEDLDSHLLPCVDMDPLLHFAKGTLPESALKRVIPNLVQSRALLRRPILWAISHHVLNEDGWILAYGDEVVHAMNYFKLGT